MIKSPPVRTCCRTSFLYKEEILDVESHELEFKGYQLEHLNIEKVTILLKTICSFLNSCGGVILLGIREDVNTKKRQVIGVELAETEKLVFLRFMSLLCEQFYPKVEFGVHCKVSFIPIKDCFVEVVRIAVVGQANHLYFYRSIVSRQLTEVYLRNDNECKALTKISQIYPEITQRSERAPGLVERHSCPQPQVSESKVHKKRRHLVVKITLHGAQFAKEYFQQKQGYSAKRSRSKSVSRSKSRSRSNSLRHNKASLSNLSKISAIPPSASRQDDSLKIDFSLISEQAVSKQVRLGPRALLQVSSKQVGQSILTALKKTFEEKFPKVRYKLEDRRIEFTGDKEQLLKVVEITQNKLKQPIQKLTKAPLKLRVQ